MTDGRWRCGAGCGSTRPLAPCAMQHRGGEMANLLTRDDRTLRDMTETDAAIVEAPGAVVL